MILSESRLLKLVHSFNKSKVAVLGDVGIDRYTSGTVDRISPEAPVPIVLVTKETLKLGLAANVAENIVTLGGLTSIVGVVGKDRNADALKSLFEEKNISSSGLVADSSRRTILKERIVAENQQMIRVDYETLSPLSEKIHSKILTSIQSRIVRANSLIIEDYAKGLLNEKLTQAVIKKAKEKEIPILVDPNLKSPIEWYSGCTLLTPNKKEAEFLSKSKIDSFESLDKAGKDIIKKAKAESLLITLGKDGMAIFKSEKAKPILIPTFAKEVFDVSGAGDTVIAVLSMALSNGAKLEEAAYIANLAAGVTVGKRGTATVTKEEILHAYITNPENINR